MIDQEFSSCLTYLNERKNSVLIEAEMRHKDKALFDQRYLESTGLIVPTDSDRDLYYIWSPDAAPKDKWGIELRLYFVADENIPTPLNILARENSRHGYEKYNKRINNNEFIWRLFRNGYHLGNN